MSETPVETIRRAAAKMRERAEAATPGPWLVDDDAPHVVLKPDKPGFSWDGTIVATVPADDFGLVDHADAEHIASWHPAVAIAVADWLDQAAIHLQGGSMYAHPLSARALHLARTYLGEAS